MSSLRSGQDCKAALCLGSYTSGYISFSKLKFVLVRKLSSLYCLTVVYYFKTLEFSSDSNIPADQALPVRRITLLTEQAR